MSDVWSGIAAGVIGALVGAIAGAVGTFFAVDAGARLGRKHLLASEIIVLVNEANHAAWRLDHTSRDAAGGREVVEHAYGLLSRFRGLLVRTRLELGDATIVSAMEEFHFALAKGLSGPQQARREVTNAMFAVEKAVSKIVEIEAPWRAFMDREAGPED